MRLEDLRFPKALVKKYGAKAGVLKYVAEQLPEIPQMPMVVSEIGETPDDLLKRADEEKIGWPRLLRSSSQVEILGYEGAFLSTKIHYINRARQVDPDNVGYYGEFASQSSWEHYIRTQIGRIKLFSDSIPVEDPKDNIPEETNVIIAEFAPCEYVGTFIGHPNRKITKIGTFTEKESIDLGIFHDRFPNADRVTISQENNNPPELERIFSNHDPENPDKLLTDINTVFSWYDKIADLPEIDPRMTMQIEAGILPPRLLQVRYFMPKEFPDFTLDKKYDSMPPIVIGITPKEGIKVEAKIVNRIKRFPSNHEPDKDLKIAICKLRDVGFSDIFEFNNRQANIFYDAQGPFAHEDVKAIRTARVSILTRHGKPPIEEGEWLNIKSDGTTAEITTLKN